MLEWAVDTVRSLVSKKVFIRALSLASLCYRLYPGSSAQAVLGFCCMQMTYDMTLSSPRKNYLLS